MILLTLEVLLKISQNVTKVIEKVSELLIFNKTGVFEIMGFNYYIRKKETNNGS